MKNEHILSAAGQIDERFLIECAQFSEERRRSVPRRRALRRFAVIAAAAVGVRLSRKK